MKNGFFFLFCFLLSTQVLFSQKGKIPVSDLQNKTRNKELHTALDSLRTGETTVILSDSTFYTDYRVFNLKNDTVYIDTTLSLRKDYVFNFLRKDNFERLSFHNQGQVFNKLGYDFTSPTLLPAFGFTAKTDNYLEINDVPYYQVPTPITEVLYRTGMGQGQVLDAVFALNFSKRMNVSIANKGMRSLGYYRRSLASHGNFRTSFHYETATKNYTVRGHITSQHFTNQENGGLTEASLTAFIEDDSNFSSSRERLDVRLNDAENYFKGTRFFLEQSIQLLSNKDSVQDTDFSNLRLGHQFNLETKKNSFLQTTATPDVFGASVTYNNIEDSVEHQVLDNQIHVDFNSKYVLGRFRAKVNYLRYTYGYENLLNSNATQIQTLKLQGEAIAVGADWKAHIQSFSLHADAHLIPGNGRLSGANFKGTLQYTKDSLFTLKAFLSLNKKTPNFNYLLHQSSYDAYNWEQSYNKVKTRNLGGIFSSKWGDASVQITHIDGYTYFNSSNAPTQADENITYLKAKATKAIVFGKFTLQNTILYQHVATGSSVFRVPDLVTRNTLCYNDHWFKGKPLHIQIGATFNYFTKYKANAYNPLLAEFTLQDDTEIGYPTLDVFLNARIKRTRLYLKVENVTSDFSPKNYFSAPNYPYRDLTIRFGLVWNWFI